MSRKTALEDELADLEGKLERAEKLVSGLAGELWRTGNLKQGEQEATTSGCSG